MLGLRNFWDGSQMTFWIAWLGGALYFIVKTLANVTTPENGMSGLNTRVLYMLILKNSILSLSIQRVQQQPI